MFSENSQNPMGLAASPVRMAAFGATGLVIPHLVSGHRAATEKCLGVSPDGCIQQAGWVLSVSALKWSYANASSKFINASFSLCPKDKIKTYLSGDFVLYLLRP